MPSGPALAALPGLRFSASSSIPDRATRYSSATCWAPCSWWPRPWCRRCGALPPSASRWNPSPVRSPGPIEDRRFRCPERPSPSPFRPGIMHNMAHVHGAPGLRTLLPALLVTLAFAAVEALAGWWSGSLALLGDAGHMLTDAAALGIAMAAAWIAAMPPSRRHSYGLVRAEVVGGLVNALLMLFIILGIVVEAVRRLRAPAPVAGGTVMLVAGAGLLVNMAVALMLSRGPDNLNLRAALLHVMGDLLGSVAALVAGAVVYFTGWTPADPILSLFICLLILYSSILLLREALHVLMEGVPRHLDFQEIGTAMARADPAIRSVHDL